MQEITRQVNGNILKETTVLSKEDVQRRVMNIDARINSLTQSLQRTQEEKTELLAYLSDMN